jgi:hypothetical protein
MIYKVRFNHDKIRDTGRVCYLTTACMQHYMDKFEDFNQIYNDIY